MLELKAPVEHIDDVENHQQILSDFENKNNWVVKMLENLKCGIIEKEMIMS